MHKPPLPNIKTFLNFGDPANCLYLGRNSEQIDSNNFVFLSQLRKTSNNFSESSGPGLASG